MHMMDNFFFKYEKEKTWIGKKGLKAPEHPSAIFLRSTRYFEKHTIIAKQYIVKQYSDGCPRVDSRSSRIKFVSAV